MNIEIFIPTAPKSADGYVKVVLNLIFPTDTQTRDFCALLLKNPFVDREYVVQDPVAKTVTARLLATATLADFKAAMGTCKISSVTTGANQQHALTVANTFAQLAEMSLRPMLPTLWAKM